MLEQVDQPTAILPGDVLPEFSKIQTKSMLLTYRVDIPDEDYIMWIKDHVLVNYSKRGCEIEAVYVIHSSESLCYVLLLTSIMIYTRKKAIFDWEGHRPIINVLKNNNDIEDAKVWLGIIPDPLLRQPPPPSRRPRTVRAARSTEVRIETDTLDDILDKQLQAVRQVTMEEVLLDYCGLKTSYRENVNAVAELLERGADLRVNGQAAISLAAQNGYSNILNLLLDNSRVNPQDCVYYQSLSLASANGHTGCVRILLGSCKWPRIALENARDCAIANRNDSIVKILIRQLL